MTADDRRPLQLRTRSAPETKDLGAALAPWLRPGDVVLLVGDLGTGKTTLTQGIAAGLGVADPVTSPTFTLVRSHRCDAPASPDPAATGAGVRTLLHADLYRLDRLVEVADLGIGELVEDDAVAVVEWGDVGAPVLGRDALVVTMAPGDAPDERRVTVGGGESWELRRAGLARRLAAWQVP